MALDLRIHRRVDAAPVGIGHTGSLPWLRPLPPDRKLWATRVPSPGWAVIILASQLVFLTLRVLVLLPWPWASRFFSGFGHLSTVTGLRMSMSAHSSSQDSESSQARLKTPSLPQVSLSDVALSFLSHQDSASTQRSTSRVMRITRNC